MAAKSGPLSVEDWLDLIRAIDLRDARARQALYRLLHHHGIDPALLARLGRGGPVPPGLRARPAEGGLLSGESRAAVDAPPASAPQPQQDSGPQSGPESGPESGQETGPEPGAEPHPEPTGTALEALLYPESDTELDFDVFSRGDGGPRWELVGPFVDLARAARITGLDANAVRMSGDGADPEATVIHPSPFCDDAMVFLGLLSVLARTTPHVRLYRVHRNAGDGAAAVLVKVFPNPGPETLALLDTFHPKAAEQVRDATRMVGDALAHLAEQAEAVPEGADSTMDSTMDSETGSLHFGSGRQA